MRLAASTSDWGAGSHRKFSRWLRTGLVPSSPLPEHKFNPNHDGLGRFSEGATGDGSSSQSDSQSSTSVSAGAASLQTHRHGSRHAKAAPFPAAMLYADALKTISDNNHSGLSDDIVLAMAWRESKLRPGSSNAVSTAKGRIGVTRLAVKDLRDRGGFDFFARRFTRFSNKHRSGHA